MEKISMLLELRNKLKDRKPDFIRQDNPKRRKLNDKWRKPKGIHSKIRHKFKGRRKMPSPGYKSPGSVSGMHTSGLKIINIHSIESLQKLNSKEEGIIIAKGVGMKKRLEILKKAKETGISVLNVNADEHIQKIQDFINSKKKEPKQKPEPKEAKSKEEAKSETISDDQKKEIDKKEKDRILTKRQ